MDSADGNRREYNRQVRPALFSEADILLLCLGGGAGLILIYTADIRWHLSVRQVQEIAAYCLLTLGVLYLLVWHLATKRSRREQSWAPVAVSRSRDRRNLED